MFNRAKPQLVEVPTTKPLAPLTSDMRQSLEVLQHNPSFDYLIQRFQRQSSVLEHKLKFERQPDQRSYEFLQSGIYWCRWLESELALLLRHPRSAPVESSQADMEAFESISKAIEILQ